MRTTLAAVLLAGIAAGPVLAQTSTSPGTTTAPGSTMPSPTAPGVTTTTTTTGALAPLAVAAPGQMLGSDLRGTRIYGANNENIGEVDDILIDRDGRIAALLVGVGGFLGIGEKNVAIPMQAFEIVMEKRSDTTASVRSGTGTGTTGTGTTTGTSGTTAGGTAGTTTTTTTTTGATAANTTRYGTIDPDHLVLRNMTKADLQNAPSFGRTGSTTGTGTTGTGTTNAPRQ